PGRAIRPWTSTRSSSAGTSTRRCITRIEPDAVLKLCIPIDYRPEGGMYTFIAGFTQFLEATGVPFTRRLDDAFDVLFVNSWAVPFDAVRSVKRARPD